MTDITGKKPLEFGAQTVADLKSILGLSDEGNANDYFYLKTEVDALILGAKKTGLLLDLQAMGNDVQSIPVGATAIGLSGPAIASGRAYGVMHIIREVTTITGIQYGQNVATPSFTANNYNGFDLCSVVGGELNQLAKTVNDPNAFTTAGFFRKAFTAPVVLQPGIYFVRAIWSASATTTAPALVTCSPTTSGGYDVVVFGTQLKPAFYQSSLTDLVTGGAISGFAGTAITPALYLY